jgi:protein MpaA
MHAVLPYEITEDIGYPTPGSLGTYAGWERQIPTITFEIERGLPLSEVWPTVRGAVLAAITG